MKNKIISCVWMCLLWLLISNCVDKFNAHLPEGDTGLLVVEGNIISDSTVVFCLSRSFALDVDNIPEDYNQIDAEVSVVGSDGSSLSAVPLRNGKYQVAVGTLNKDVSYSLKIVYDGNTYTSEPQTPLVTEAIDGISFEQPEDYGDIYIRVSTHSEGAGYYLWDYEEDWEVRAQYYTRWFYDPKTDKVTVYDTAPYVQGWCHGEASKIWVGSTESNTENRLKNKRLYSIASNSLRVSYYYSTLMKQRKLSKGEYEYYQEKVKLNEEMGGLFTPQPSELPTNISCSDPNKMVIGYVGVNMNVTESRFFISYKDIQYEDPLDCRLMEESEVKKHSINELYSMGYRIAYFMEMEGYSWAKVGCTDVRDLGATLDKPSFWPDKIN